MLRSASLWIIRISVLFVKGRHLESLVSNYLLSLTLFINVTYPCSPYGWSIINVTCQFSFGHRMDISICASVTAYITHPIENRKN